MPRIKRFTLSVLFIAGLLTNGAPRAQARKSAKIPAPNNDQIEVIGHIAFDGTGVTQVMTGEHWRRNYFTSVRLTAFCQLASPFGAESYGEIWLAAI